MSQSLRQQKGFSMIEILIALVILAIGLLGMATLMMNSLQTSQSAAMRSAATLAAYDLAERMRSNIDEEVLEDKEYETTLQPANRVFSSRPADACANCTAKELARHDLEVWAYALDEALPGAQVIVRSEGTVPVLPGSITSPNRLWCIGIFWEDTGGREVVDTTTDACGERHVVNGKPWAFYEVKVLL